MSKKSKTDLLVRQRYQNPLPPPAFPPKLLTIQTDPARYATYDFLVPLSMERATPMIVDAEGGMHLDQNLVPGYWEALAQQGRNRRMAPDLNDEDTPQPELDDEDLALLVDPPGPSAAGTGVLPPGSSNHVPQATANAHSTPGAPAHALDRRKKEVAWLLKAGKSVDREPNMQAKHDALANSLAAHQAAIANAPAELSESDQLALIESTFVALDEMPLAQLKHPTKAHLEAVEVFDLYPDEQLWGNQYNVVKFADDPLAQIGFTDLQTSAHSIIRPLGVEDEDTQTSRIALYLPDSQDAAESYASARRLGKTVDQDILDDTDEATASNAVDDYGDAQRHSFRFIRDYEATVKVPRAEFVISLADSTALEDQKGEGPSSTAYYVPVQGQTILRKRRARKGEAINDYSALGDEDSEMRFWHGINLELAGKDILPEDERLARKEDIEALGAVRTQPSGGSNGHTGSIAEEAPAAMQTS